MSLPEVQRVVDAPPGMAGVRGFLHLPSGAASDGLVLTHGASGNSEAPLLVALANLFAEAGVTVLRCDLPFRQTRPHGSPTRGSSQKDQEGLRRAVAVLRQSASRRLFLGGQSYGGRQASMLAASDPALVEGLLLLSYPLHPPKQRAELRTAHFPSLRTPALFVSGTRDGFGSIEELNDAVRLIPARTQVMPIAGAGHGLLTARNREELPQTIVETFRRFVAEDTAKSA